ncbi:MAG: N-acetylmuramic acid 6-phosphate etherase, partial [Deltaproteobacteria bacterium]|nr:N-acetylmuramic acid 6-phosphate etherase [Deltaproteobacteria bacterium]
MTDRGGLLTEQLNPKSAQLDALSVSDAFDVMHAEDATIAAAVRAAKPQIVNAIELIAARLKDGGRLIYVGAGTSGRLGVLDAAECPPTFLTDPETVQGIIAGGPDALQRSIENAEDDAGAGAAAVEARHVGSRDVVFGIAAGGTTPFVHGALQQAHSAGAATVFLACVPREQADDEADISIRVLTGPEVVTGSTRLKAGIATRMVLNQISTLSLVQLGKVYGNLMVDVNALGCTKLTDRALRTVMRVTKLEREAAQRLLERCDWHVKTAIVVHALQVEPVEAR